MSQYNIKDCQNPQSEKPQPPQPMKINEEFPWFTVIMMMLCLIVAAGWVAALVVAIVKGH